MANNNTECEASAGREWQMNRLASMIGTLLTVFGVVLFAIVYVNAWNCAHSASNTGCYGPGPILFLFVYPVIIIGVSIVAYSFLTSRRPQPHPHASNEEKLNRFELLAGILLTATGAYLTSLHFISAWLCAHSSPPSLCVRTTLPTIFPSLVIIGLVLIAFSFLSRAVMSGPSTGR